MYDSGTYLLGEIDDVNAVWRSLLVVVVMVDPSEGGMRLGKDCSVEGV